MPQAPFDDLPQPYGPGWWETWPGETPRDAAPAAIGTPAPAPVVAEPGTPVVRRFVRTLGEYMQAVRAAVPYLGDVAATPPADSHHAAARTLIGRVSESAARAGASTQGVARPEERPLDETSPLESPVPARWRTHSHTH